MIKINANKYIHAFRDWPSMEMELSGWDWEIKWFLGIIPYVIYTK